jgi:hypothetical protein
VNNEYINTGEGKKISDDDCLSALINIDEDIAHFQSLRSNIGRKLAKNKKKKIDLEQEFQVIEDRLRYLRSIKNTIRLLMSKG